MTAPTAADLSAFTGQQLSSDQATAVINVVTAMASSYTRGIGFDGGVPSDALRAVVLSASARMITDVSGIRTSEQMGPFVVQYSGNHAVQWSTAELTVLNDYRVRAL